MNNKNVAETELGNIEVEVAIKNGKEEQLDQ